MTKITRNHQLYSTPSYLGGSFTVRVKKELGDGKLEVVIHMPGNPDFHGHTTVRRRDSLKPIEG